MTQALDSERMTIPSISVLLVDDNEQWANFMADEIQRVADDIDVTTALNANQAMLVIRDREDIDCIVADYQMPSIDGIQLLERIRSHSSDLPFLLVTAEGSEDVAMRAIDAGVTDYLVKDIGTDQTMLFVNKIRTAVEQFHLQAALKASEQRYRLLTEQSRDAIAIYNDGVLDFCNERLIELTGLDTHDLTTEPFIETVVYPEDRVLIEQAISAAMDRSEHNPVHDVRIQTAAENVRDCEISGHPISYDGADCVMLSIRDVTERKQRKRALEWERELNRNVQEALVESRTRGELERTTIDLLERHGYELVWIGELQDGVLEPRTQRQDGEYIGQIDRSIDNDAVQSEPAIWTARTDEAQFVNDIEMLFETTWQEFALAAGLQSGAGIPLTYNDITYGVLGVYHGRPGHFDDAERRLLNELADTLAFAIHSLETEASLTSDEIVEVTLSIRDESYYLNELAAAGVFRQCDVAQVVGSVPVKDGAVIQYIVVDRAHANAIAEAFREVPAVEAVKIIEEGDPARLQVLTTAVVPETVLAGKGCRIRQSEIGSRSIKTTLELPPERGVRDIVDRLGDVFESVKVHSMLETDRDRDDPWSETLTDKQAAALEAAYHHGYFEQPRLSSATDVAESLDISHTTFLQHLKTAQQKLLKYQYS